MPNNYFQFKQFTIHQDRCAMKVTTDACLFGAWVSERVGRERVGSRESGVGREAGVRNILDIGTGTGLLALMVAQKVNCLIDTIEIDGDAFEQARENFSASPWRDRINIYQGDAKEFSPAMKYDVIISNPPFYANELKSVNYKRNMAHHGGLALNDLMNFISKNLQVGGEFYMLLPGKRAMEAESLLSKCRLSIVESLMVRQSTMHDQFRMIVKGTHAANSEQSYRKKEMSIWDENRKYTEEFVELLRDYYLNL